MHTKMNSRFWLLGLLILIGGIIFLQSNKGYAAPGSLGEIASNLEQDLGQLEQLLADAERDLSVQRPVTPYLEELKATVDRLDWLVQGIRADFAAFDERIPLIFEDKELQELAADRQAEAKADFEQRWLRLTTEISQFSRLNQISGKEQLAALKDCRRAVRQLIARQHNPLNVNNLPLKGVSWEDNSSPVINQPALASFPTDEDLAPTPQAPFTPSIVKLAKALDHDPLQIYNWVRQNIRYLPLFGSIKGAQRCLSDREGNDFDQASLLVALFRAAKIPARYVYGETDLSLKLAADWLGVKNPLSAQAILQRGGIPYEAEKIERVWVKAYLDNAWVELDPAFKQCVWEDGLAVDEGLSWVAFSPEERQLLQTALGVPLLDNSSLAAGQKKRGISSGGDSLPADFPKSILSRKWEATQIPHEFQYWLKVELEQAQGDVPGNSVELSMAQLLTQPLSLLYLPVDKREARIMDALMLELDDESDADTKKIGYMPGYLVRVKPHLLLGDQVLARGEPVCLGTPQQLSLSFKAPLQSIAPVKHMVIAGTQATIGLNMGDMSLESLKSLEGEAAAPGGLLPRLMRYVAEVWNDELGLGVFKHTAWSYHQQNNRLAQFLAQNNGVYVVPFMGEALVAQAAEVAYAFDIPVFFRYSGVSFDLQRDSFVITPLADDPEAGNRFLSQAGVYGSMLEHRVLEQIEDKRIMTGEAVSTVKALQIAQRQGVPLFHLTPANAGQIWPQLQLSRAIQRDIEAAVAKGYEVILPQQEVSLNEWQGLGYIVQEAGTGNRAYLISGGLAGGFGGGGTATSSISGGLPRSTLGKIIVIILILAAVVVLAAM